MVSKYPESNLFSPDFLQQREFGVRPHDPVARVQQLVSAIESDTAVIQVVSENNFKQKAIYKILKNLLGKDRFFFIHISNPNLSPQALRYELADQFEIAYDPAMTEQMLLEVIYSHLLVLSKQSKKTLLMVKHSSRMQPETLESLRIFTELEAEQGKLIQLILFDLVHCTQEIDQTKEGLDKTNEVSLLDQAFEPMTAEIGDESNKYIYSSDNLRDASTFQAIDTYAISGVSEYKDSTSKLFSNKLTSFKLCLFLVITVGVLLVAGWCLVYLMYLSHNSLVASRPLWTVPHVLVFEELKVALPDTLPTSRKPAFFSPEFEPLYPGAWTQTSLIDDFLKNDAGPPSKAPNTRDSVQQNIGAEFISAVPNRRKSRWKSLPLRKTSVSSVANSVESLLEAGNYEDAFYLIDESVSAYRDPTKILLSASEVLLRKNAVTEAINLVERYKSAPWVTTVLLAQLVVLYDQSRQFGPLERLYIELTEREPTNVIWVLGLANLYDIQNQFSKALKLYRQAVLFSGMSASKKSAVKSRIRALSILK